MGLVSSIRDLDEFALNVWRMESEVRKQIYEEDRWEVSHRDLMSSASLHNVQQVRLFLDFESVGRNWLT